MSEKLRADLARIERLAFGGVTKARAFAMRLDELSADAVAERNIRVIQKLREWVVVPFSLWPIDVAGVGMQVLDVMEAGAELDAQVRLMVQMLPEPPSEEVCAAVAEYEHAVKEGSYESLINAQFKFDSIEEELAESAEFKADWERIQKAFEVERFCNKNGVIRRRMVGERNFRPKGWNFSAKGEREVFENVFDAFCAKWNLYGVIKEAVKTSNSKLQTSKNIQTSSFKEEGDLNPKETLKISGPIENSAGWNPAIQQVGNLRYESCSWRPLLLKLTVNVTPYGTLISVPRYWSFDPKRDLKWGAVTKLHRVREVKRQGPKLSSSMAARRAEAAEAKRLYAQATKAGMKGERRTLWVMNELGWDVRTDESRLRRMLKDFKMRNDSR